MQRLLGAVATAIALLGSGLAAARPFTVDDMLAQESLGAQALDPSGRWLVFEQRGRYDAAPRFDRHFATGQTLGRLRVTAVNCHAPPRPLLKPDPGPGLVLGPFSPSGDRLAVFDARHHGWRLGVVEVATGKTRWFDITPQEARRGRALQWVSDRTFLVLDRPDGWPPTDLRDDVQVQARLSAAWSRAASGEGDHTVLGSGAYAAVRLRAPARRLRLVDAVSGRVRTLAVGDFIDLELSPHADKVALFAAGRDRQPRPQDPVRGPAGQETEVTELSVLDLASGRRTAACPGCDLLPNLLAWSPSGRELLVFDRGADGLWLSGRLLRVDAGSGAIHPLPGDLEPHATLNPVSFRAGWMGEAPLIYGRPRGAARWGWLRFDGAAWRDLTEGVEASRFEVLAVDAQQLILLADDRVIAVDAQGRMQDLGASPAALSLRRFRGTPTSRLVNALPSASFVTLGPPGRRTLAWASGGNVTPVMAAPDGAGDLVAASSRGAVAVTRALTPTGVERLQLHRAKGASQTVTTINARLGDTDPPEAVAVHHRGAQGEPLTSWMFLPNLPSGAPPPPVIVRPYLGYSYAAPPRDLYMEQGFFQNLRILTGHGYAVLTPSLPDPPGGMTDPAAHVADRILSVMAAAEAEPALKGRFDSGRAAILGWSFGGYTTMATITQTNRFRAAVALDGISDLVDYWSTLSLWRALVPEDGYGSIGVTGTVESTQPQLGAPPWKDLDRYTRNSPLLYADRIETPLLLIHGGLDPVPLSGSEAMYSALFRQGKDAMLVIYWGANHAATAPGDVRDVWARTFRFLDAHLTPPTGGSPSGSPEPESASGAPRPPPPPR